jgi:hypothetical protein
MNTFHGKEDEYYAYSLGVGRNLCPM